MAKINILMATYNGEHFIEQQLLSIIGQTYKDWQLLIHDDQSTDNTVAVIKKWASVDSRIILVDDGVKCGGAANNFMHLVQLADADFVMFCDQDDIWLDNKIEVMLNAIQQRRNNIPQVIYSRAYVWRTNGDFEGFIPYVYPKKINDLLFILGGIHGCISIFNKVTLNIMKRQPQNQAMHDHLLSLVGVTMGEVSYINQPLTLYRRHTDVVTSQTVTPTSVWQRITGNSNVPVVDRKHFNADRQFYEFNKESLSSEVKKTFDVYFSMEHKSTLSRLWLVLSNNFTLGGRLQLLVKIIRRPYIN